MRTASNMGRQAGNCAIEISLYLAILSAMRAFSPLPRSLVLITFDDHIRPLHLLQPSCSFSPSSIRLYLSIVSCLLSHWISLTTRYRVGLTRKTRRKPFELKHRNALSGKR